ncbi:DUF6708 domain-containing protein [Achromobacter spanius]|uniref:DUF6708 domain-containing protein n=1 Tax=Achromobacter spanius TaxID=217203 RepID=A0A2S0I6Z3_9BURK|nr:DUF6708 domain-containing protein [Achromobacter spanius]AVJ27810.1 hypothetical protein CLM73_12170 [Achromobacter spanius]
MTIEVKRLPKNLRFGGTPLSIGSCAGHEPQPDGVRWINDKCVELETYPNYIRSGAAGYIGMSALVFAIIFASVLLALGPAEVDLETVLIMLSGLPVSIGLAFVFYIASGAHRSRGAFIRIHRDTRKLYFVSLPQKRLHALDWDHIEALAGYIPVVSTSGYTSRHPLYLIGVDRGMSPPTEICVACGNLGLFDGDRSAKALWAYLQAFMAQGPEGLPEPAPLPPRLSRRQETLQPYRKWYAGLCRRLAEPYGMLMAPITIPLWIILLLIEAYPDSVEAFIQFNVPYTQFPKEIDRLCGFDETT